MKRVMIQAEEELLGRARREAARRHVSIAQLVREALERELGEARQPLPLSSGTFRSVTRDLSERASRDEYAPEPPVSA